MKIIFGIGLLLTTLSAAEHGVASWYGKENKTTCKGKPTLKNVPAVAHKSLPIGTYVRIVSKTTNKSVVAVVEDRGPYCKNRIVDLNVVAATQLGIIKSGIDMVTIYKVNN